MVSTLPLCEEFKGIVVKLQAPPAVAVVVIAVQFEPPPILYKTVDLLLANIPVKFIVAALPVQTLDATAVDAKVGVLPTDTVYVFEVVKPPEPEWGLMLNTLRTAIYVQPWIAALPGVMIFVTSIAFNLLSDGLRTAMEIKN